MANKLYCGWDVGGAHLKAALLDADGHVLRVLQLPCALWLGLQMLEAAIDQILLGFYASTKNAPLRHAVTMTGELVDLFANRQQGVQKISQVMQQKLGEELFFFCASMHENQHFVTHAQVAEHWQQIASANWFASAKWMAKSMPTGLLIDMGSTTTDFIVLHQGQPQCVGLNDAERMAAQELVYTGVVRTPLMAVTCTIEFKGQQTGIAAEYFATTADVYRLLAELPTNEDMADTADGKDKSTVATARRIARMIGRDVEEGTPDDWRNLALNFKQRQLAMLREAALQHIARLIKLAPTLTAVRVMGAGAGQFLIQQLVAELNQTKTTLTRGLDFQYIACNAADQMHFSSTENMGEIANWATICLPAVAVAKLALEQSR